MVENSLPQQVIYFIAYITNNYAIKIIHTMARFLSPYKIITSEISDFRCLNITYANFFLKK